MLLPCLRGGVDQRIEALDYGGINRPDEKNKKESLKDQEMNTGKEIVGAVLNFTSFGRAVGSVAQVETTRLQDSREFQMRLAVVGRCCNCLQSLL